MHNEPSQDACECDVLVIGGGPAGTTIATTLAQKGWQIVLLEKDHHPRFHIGESLLPMNLPIFERLGVLDKIHAIGVMKYGAEFNSTEYNKRETFYFAEAMDKNHPYAFQVLRSEFDHILFQNCTAKGVDTREGVKVTDVNFQRDARHQVRAQDENGVEQVWAPRFLIDASGRDTFLARRFGWKQKNPQHHSAAIFGHFNNVARRSGEDAGNISIYWFEHGWFWMIPLRNDIMSVGAVCWPRYLKTRNSSPEAFLSQTIQLCPEVHERMQNAQMQGKVNITGNYTYRSTQMYGDNYLLIGDAFAFLDPVFSSGVYLAMAGAEQGAEVVDAYLRADPHAARIRSRYAQRMTRGLSTVSWFIYRFTSPPLHKMFMGPRNYFRIKEAVISMLAGDVFRNTPIWTPLLLFKTIYYLLFAGSFSRSWQAFTNRQANVSERFTDGTTMQDTVD